ncbi:MAG: hypothetical protein WC869_15575, partial [Phycisphaerae bacterium]
TQFLRLNPDFLVLIHRCLLMWIVNMRRYSDYSESARRICHTPSDSMVPRLRRVQPCIAPTLLQTPQQWHPIHRLTNNRAPAATNPSRAQRRTECSTAIPARFALAASNWGMAGSEVAACLSDFSLVQLTAQSRKMPE